jgi:hypothetical protein
VLVGTGYILTQPAQFASKLGFPIWFLAHEQREPNSVNPFGDFLPAPQICKDFFPVRAGDSMPVYLPIDSASPLSGKAL